MLTNNKTAVIFGGSGFVGCSLIKKYLTEGWNVIVPSRKKIAEEVVQNIACRMKFNPNEALKLSRAGMLQIITSFDASKKLFREGFFWDRTLSLHNTALNRTFHVINLITDTSGRPLSIHHSNIETLETVFYLVNYLRTRRYSVTFGNMGSIAESDNSKFAGPYERTKRLSKSVVAQTGLCDYHFVAGYIKGRGEEKMKSAAPVLWQLLRYSHRWLFGFETDVVDVDDVSNIIFEILNASINNSEDNKPNQYTVTIVGTEYNFGKMVTALLPHENRIVPKALFSNQIEYWFLRLYSFLVPHLFPNNQYKKRLARFAFLSTLSKDLAFKYQNITLERDVLARYNNQELTLVADSPYKLYKDVSSHHLFVLTSKPIEVITNIIQQT